MFHQFLRFPQLRRAASAATILSCIAALTLLALGTYRALMTTGADEGELALKTVLPLAGGAVLMAWTVATWCLLELSGKSESHAFRTYDVLQDMRSTLDEHTRALQAISENSQLSDAARSIAHREREQDVLRQAINEDIVREDWEGAYYLVEQLERRFGYKLESEALRRDIDNSRTTLIERKIQEQVAKIKTLLSAHQWDPARRGIDHLAKHHPNHPGVQDLPQEFDLRWGEHKRRLLKEWDMAVQRDDVDNGIRILRELDQYLKPSEAEALKEGARDVFRAKLHNLGVQFSIAVTEHQWSRAIEIGDQIIEQFPNSRMANEVREKYDVLKNRAAKKERKENAAAQA